MSSPSLLTVDRAMQVLNMFTLQSRQWGVSELARETGLDKSQAHRIVATLAARGYLVADPVSRRYGLGPRLVALGRVAEQAPFSRTVLITLARVCHASAVFCYPDGAFYRCAVAIDSPGVLSATIVGEQFPGYGGGATGDVIFAHLPEDEVREVLGRELHHADGSPGESWEQLLKRYEEIRRTGIAVSFGEYDSRVGAVAAPVLVKGAIIGSVSVLVPRQEMHDAVELMSRAVMDAASELIHLYETGVSTAARPASGDSA